MAHADNTMILRVYQHALDRQKKTTVESLPSPLNMTKLYDQKRQ